MNAIKKIIVFVGLVAIASLGFISCSNEDESINNGKTSQQVNIKSENIPDGVYIGYYYLSNGNKIEIKETYKDNVLVERLIDGKKQDLSLAPKQMIIWSQGTALDVALHLSETYPCVSIVVERGFPQRESVMYNVLYDSEEPCWYDN